MTVFELVVAIKQEVARIEMELPSHPVGKGNGFEGRGSLRGRAVRRQLCRLERRGYGPGPELGTSHGVGRALLILQGDVCSDCLG